MVGDFLDVSRRESMSAGSARALAPVGIIPRRVSRHAIAIPVDVTVLRSGIPNNIPGRSLDLGEGGMSAVLAAEFRLGDSVGLEFRLPDVSAPLRAKAVVRHQAQLQCGFEFLGLSQDQQASIRYWARRRTQPQTEIKPSETLPSQASAPQASPLKAFSRTLHRVLWIALLIFVAVGAAGWWQWYRAWNELEAHVPGRVSSIQPSSTPYRATVPAEVMQRLIIHKVDPIYPEAMRRANVHGTVVLAALIGRDGTVVKLHPISGPEALGPTAIEAVRWWRFHPYRINDKAVDVETTLTVEFPPAS
jgi:TonB family protein